MTRLLIVILLMILFAYFAGDSKKTWSNPFFVALVVAYSLFVGLRTSYNDTPAYIRSFLQAEPIAQFLTDPERMDLMHNPLFYGASSFVRGFTANYHIFFLMDAVFVAILLMRFFRKHSQGRLWYAVLLFWGFGLGMFGAAAMKQITAMAVLTLAYEAMLEKKWVRFVLIVLVASLIHTYAVLFLLLPFFLTTPWNWRTIALLAATAFVIMNFNEAISSALEYVDAAGKTVSAEEVFDGNQMNQFRVALFSVVPLSCLVFRRRLAPHMTREICLLANMSIIGWAFILMGAVNGANMFGRLAMYFVFGHICLMEWIIDKVFNRRSAKLLMNLSVLLFFVFLMYDNRSIDAYGGYRCISLLDFLLGKI